MAGACMLWVMTIWGKLYYALFVPKCRWCKTPVIERGEVTCSPACDDLYERLNTY